MKPAKDLDVGWMWMSLAFDSGYIGRGRGRLLLYCPPAAAPPPSALWSTDLCTRIGSVRLCLVYHIHI